MKRTIFIFFYSLMLVIMMGCEQTQKSFTHYYLYDTYTGPVDVYYSRPDVDSIKRENNIEKSSFKVDAATEVTLADIERVDYTEKYTRIVLSDSVVGWVETRVIRPRVERYVQRVSMTGYDTHLTRAYTFGEELTNAGSPVIGKIVLNDEFMRMFRRDYQRFVRPLYIALASVGTVMFVLWLLLTRGVVSRQSIFKSIYIGLWITFILAFAIEIVLGCVCDADPTKIHGEGFWNIAFNFLIVILSVLTLLLQWKVMPSLFSNLLPFERIPGIKIKGKSVDHTKGNLAVLALLAFLMVLCMLVWKKMVDVVFWIMVVVQVIESVLVIIDATRTKQYFRSILYIIFLPLFFALLMIIILSFKTAIGLVFMGYAVIASILSDPQGFLQAATNSGRSGSSSLNSVQTSSGENLEIMEDLGNGRVLDSRGEVRRRVSDSSNIFKKLEE